MPPARGELVAALNEDGNWRVALEALERLDDPGGLTRADEGSWTGLGPLWRRRNGGMMRFWSPSRGELRWQ